LWIDISSGSYHTCGIREENNQNKLYCWGNNEKGQLGTSDYELKEFPTEVAGDNNSWISVNAGDDHTCAIKSIDGKTKIYCWGDNFSRQLGLPVTYFESLSTPQEITNELSDWKLISADSSHSCAIKSEYNYGKLYCWGENFRGKLAQKYNEADHEAKEILGENSNWKSISGIGNSTCAIKNNDDTFCWGYGWDYIFGNNSKLNFDSPIKIDLGDLTFESIYIGYQHSCGIANSNNKELYCWGENEMGENEVGLTGTFSQEKEVKTPEKVQGENKEWLNVTLGLEHTCGIRRINDKNHLFCWGNNENGQLGIGNIESTIEPVSVQNENGSWVKVSAGFYHTCGLKSIEGTNKIYCWGKNEFGEVGDNTTAMQKSPTEVAGINRGWVTLSSGGNHSCGIKKENNISKIYCWGNNEYGTLGTGANNNSSIPVEINTENENWVNLKSSGNISCGLKQIGENRKLFCWGKNEWFNVISSSDKSIFNIPTEIEHQLFYKEFALSDNKICAIIEDEGVNKIYCWGDINVTGRGQIYFPQPTEIF